MAVHDLTITSQRSQVVDFSVPYQTSTLQILIKVKMPYFLFSLNFFTNFSLVSEIRIKITWDGNPKFFRPFFWAFMGLHPGCLCDGFHLHVCYWTGYTL